MKTQDPPLMDDDTEAVRFIETSILRTLNVAPDRKFGEDIEADIKHVKRILQSMEPNSAKLTLARIAASNLPEYLGDKTRGDAGFLVTTTDNDPRVARFIELFRARAKAHNPITRE